MSLANVVENSLRAITVQVTVLSHSSGQAMQSIFCINFAYLATLVDAEAMSTLLTLPSFLFTVYELLRKTAFACVGQERCSQISGTFPTC